MTLTKVSIYPHAAVHSVQYAISYDIDVLPKENCIFSSNFLRFKNNYFGDNVAFLHLIAQLYVVIIWKNRNENYFKETDVKTV